MADTIAGWAGSLTVANYDAHAHAWSIDIECEMLEDTNWKDWTAWEKGWRSYIPGLKGWGGSFECRADDAPAVALLPGTRVTLAKFYVDLVNTMGYAGDIYISAVHPSATVEGLQAITFDFIGDGRVQIGDLSAVTTE